MSCDGSHITWHGSTNKVKCSEKAYRYGADKISLVLCRATFNLLLILKEKIKCGALLHNKERKLGWGMDKAAPLRPWHLSLLLLALTSKDLPPHLALEANLR